MKEESINKMSKVTTLIGTQLTIIILSTLSFFSQDTLAITPQKIAADKSNNKLTTINKKSTRYLWFIPNKYLLSQNNFTQKEDFYFATDLWPGEGIPQFSAKETINVFTIPNQNSSPVEGINIQPNTKIIFNQTLLKTITPVGIKIDKKETITARNYGKVNFISRSDYYDNGREQTLIMQPGDILKVLSYRAEGEYFFEFREQVFAGQCSLCSLGEPTQEWWVKTEIKGKNYWILINNKSVNFLPRLF